MFKLMQSVNLASNCLLALSKLSVSAAHYGSTASSAEKCYESWMTFEKLRVRL